jgi:transposase-like protein
MVERQVSTLDMGVRFPPPASRCASDLFGTLFSRMKTAERAEARRLRRHEGLSIKEIARRVGVAQSSVSVWVRDVELTEEQASALVARIYRGHVKGRTINAALRRDTRRLAQEAGRELARRGDPLHLAGCMLYWAEGAKERNQLRFSNSDPEMVRFFVEFLKSHFQLRDEDIRVTCNLFADHLQRQHQIEQFWLDTAGLPRSCLCRSTVNVYSKYSKKKRQNKLPYGTCRIVVSRTRVTQSIFGAIQEYAGFERPAWLE